MNGFEVFEHTSDLGVTARGETLEDSLASLLRGVFSAITDLSTVAPDRDWIIRAAGEDLDEAAVRLVNEALFVHDTEGALWSKVSVRISRQGASGSDRPGADARVVIEARCSGEVFDPARHTIRRYIKAATYHGIKVTPHEVRLILDV